VRIAQLVPGPAANETFVMILNKNTGTLEALLWNGSTLGSKQTITADVSGSNVQEAFTIADVSAEQNGSQGWKYNVRYLP
jgi:hypothetical protein